LQLRRLELEAAERQHKMEAAERQRQLDLEAAERKYKIDAAERQRQLELEAEKEKRALELEVAERQKKLELEAEEKKRAHKLEMKRLELAAQSGTALADIRHQAPAFRIDTAVKLIPKFNEHDVESFLLSFEKIAQLNKFPEDKYAVSYRLT